jgi:hypothetical protein
MALIVEVLQPRGGEVRHRLRLVQFPVSVGRQLDNDLVLDDPFVDAHHARFVLEEGGTLVLEDLGSVNRLSVPSHPRAERVRLAPGAELTVGRTRLRIRDDLAPVPAALALQGGAPSDDAALPWYERRRAHGAAIAAAALAIGVNAWLGSTDRSAGVTVLSASLAFIAVGLVWAGIWAVAGRAVVGQFRIGAHLAIVSWVTLASLLLGYVGSWLDFLAPDNDVTAVLQVGVGLLLVAALVAAHLGRASMQPRGTRWVIGSTVSGVGIVLVAAFALLGDDEFTDVPTFSGTIRSAPAAIVPKQTVEEFSAVMADLRGEVDSLIVSPTSSPP